MFDQQPLSIKNQPKHPSAGYKLPELVATVATPLAEALFKNANSFLVSDLETGQTPEQEKIRKYEIIKQISFALAQNLYDEKIGYGNDADKLPYHKDGLKHIKTFQKRAELMILPLLESGELDADYAVACICAIVWHDVVQTNSDLKQFNFSEAEFDTKPVFIEIKGKKVNINSGNKEKASAEVALAILDTLKNTIGNLGLDFDKIRTIMVALVLDTVPEFVPGEGVYVHQEKMENLPENIIPEKRSNQRKILEAAIGLDFMAGAYGAFVEYNGQSLNIAPANGLVGSILVNTEIQKLEHLNQDGSNISAIKNKLVELITTEEIQFQKTAYTQLESLTSKIETINQDWKKFIYTNSAGFFEFFANKIEQMNDGEFKDIYVELISAPDNYSNTILDLLAEFEQTRVANAQVKLDELRSSLQ